MKGIARFCRLILGVVLVFSGFVKLLAPVGTSLIIKEYLLAFHCGFMAPASLVLGIALSLLEFLTGIALLLRLRLRFASGIALVMISVFTLLTLYLAIFNPIEDCGCFGEAVHLTNWQTFYKNLVLLPCAIIIFAFRKRITEFRYPVWEWIFLGLFAGLAVAVLLQIFMWSPLVEFTAYKIGSEIKSEPQAESVPQYETEFIYEKDGRTEQFTLENLPDSTWTFVEAVTTTAPGGRNANASDADFLIESPQGYDITEDILTRRKLLLMSVYHPDKLCRKSPDAVARVRDAAQAQGMDFVLVAADNMECVPDDCPVNRADLKLLMTLNRSNGGVTYLDDGVIVRKWTRTRAVNPEVNFFGDKDADLTLLMSLNRQRMVVEIVAVIFILLCLLKFFVFYKKKE
ncbi:MAG: hypothetical protein J5693_00930 [Bacteroidales bacterium]|nr:hypothetical protein [Bacteroidales bacterium]